MTRARRASWLDGLLSLAAICLGTASLQAQVARYDVAPPDFFVPSFPRPALEPARITGELVIGAYAGVGGWFVGQYVGHMIGDNISTATEETRKNLAIAFGTVGGGLGTAGGVFSIGTIGKQTGSFSATLLGAGVGAGVAWGLDHLLFAARTDGSRDASKFQWTEALIGTILPSIGGTIGFNSSRRVR